MPKNALIFTVKHAVTAGLIYWVLRNVELQSLLDRLDRISVGLLLVAAALVFFQNAVVVAWRWERVVGIIDAPPRPWELLRATVVSLFFNQVLPSTIGGDGMRIWLLRSLGRPISLAFRSVLIDRLIGLFALLALGLLGGLGLVLVLGDSGPAWIMVLASTAGLVLIVLAPLLVRSMRWIPFERLRSSFDALAREVELLAGNRRRLAELVLASLVGQVALSGAVFFLARALEIPLDFWGAMAVVPGVLVAASVPVSIAGWGVREGSMVVGLGLLGIAEGDAALISIGLGLLFLVFGLLGGLLWVLQGRTGPAPLYGAASPADRGTD